jgi:hypothetical protein
MSLFVVLSIKNEDVLKINSLMNDFECWECKNPYIMRFVGSSFKNFYITINSTSEKLVVTDNMGLKENSRTYKEINRNFYLFKEKLSKLLNVSKSIKMFIYFAKADQDSEEVKCIKVEKIVLRNLEILDLPQVKYNVLYHFICN